jgi:hypothetical protein
MPARRLAVKAAKDAARKAAARSMAVRPQAAPQRAALPAPPKRLALPPPDPSRQLPPLAAKPRGGQFYTEKVPGGYSPEEVARRQADDLSTYFYNNDELLAALEPGSDPNYVPPLAGTVRDWLARSLAKYYKTEFGAPEDPLRDLAARGLHYDAGMTPPEWSSAVDDFLVEDPLQHLLFPSNPKGGMPGAGDDLRGGTLAAMPWLAKAPATDSVYGIRRDGLELSHFADELKNALNPDASGLPADLALRPESLARMSFPQAVERVGRINQFRAKQMEEAAKTALDNPAIQTFKEYPDAGYRWVELRAPEIEGGDPRRVLEDALRFEGDTMGHCVGGYCDDVLSGRSRIFSLRDVKGQPHVTIEAAPAQPTYAALKAAVGQDEADRLLDEAIASGLRDDRARAAAFERAGVPVPQDIIQIKGKQNRAPVDDYLPYVQDFVKSGTWSNIGDFGNTGLAKLPDGRFITKAQLDEVMNSPAVAEAIGPVPEWTSRTANIQDYTPEQWQRFAPFFEGFAIGGRVSKDRCFSRHPMSVR